MFVFLFLFILSLAHGIQLNTNPTIEKDLFPFPTYGKWCGGGHGGYQDCFQGNPAPACNTSDPGISLECIQQCPPIDQLDFQCAFHDHCTFSMIAEANMTCSPQGNFCGCDCILNNRIDHVVCQTEECILASKAIQKLFSYVTSCWYFDDQHTEICDDYKKGIPLNNFCPPPEQLKLYSWEQLPDLSRDNMYRNGNQYECYQGFQYQYEACVPVN